jgi:hypothetical protein
MLKREFIACERNDNRFLADNSWAMIFIRLFIELWQEWWSERKNTRGSEKPRVQFVFSKLSKSA